MDVSPLIIIGAIVLGVFSGLIPGLHPNSIGAIITSAGGGDYIPIVLMIVLGLYCAISFIPAMFFGIPQGDTQISLLPAQRMLKEGKAKEAITVFATSAIVAAVLSILLVPFAFPIMPAIYAAIKPWTGWILLLAAIVLILHEKEMKKIAKAMVIFLLAGILGNIVLNMPLNDPLFALFAGFFTIPALALAQNEVEGVKEASAEEMNFKFDYLPFILLGVLFGALADFIPGISTPAQIAVFTGIIFSMDSARNFLAHVASIEVSHNIFAISSAASFGVARVGTVALSNQVVQITQGNMYLLMGAFLLALGVGTFFLLKVGVAASRKFAGKNIGAAAKLVALYLLIIMFLNDGWMGIAVLVTASAIGILGRLWNIGRTHVMGSLIVPSIIRAFGIFV